MKHIKISNYYIGIGVGVTWEDKYIYILLPFVVIELKRY